jgi:hypothetical protein
VGCNPRNQAKPTGEESAVNDVGLFLGFYCYLGIYEHLLYITVLLMEIAYMSSYFLYAFLLALLVPHPIKTTKNHRCPSPGRTTWTAKSPRGAGGG